MNGAGKGTIVVCRGLERRWLPWRRGAANSSACDVRLVGDKLTGGRRERRTHSPAACVRQPTVVLVRALAAPTLTELRELIWRPAPGHDHSTAGDQNGDHEHV